jgi:hypothetical protein
LEYLSKRNERVESLDGAVYEDQYKSKLNESRSSSTSSRKSRKIQGYGINYDEGEGEDNSITYTTAAKKSG